MILLAIIAYLAIGAGFFIWTVKWSWDHGMSMGAAPISAFFWPLFLLYFLVMGALYLVVKKQRGY